MGLYNLVFNGVRPEDGDDRGEMASIGTGVAFSAPPMLFFSQIPSRVASIIHQSHQTGDCATTTVIMATAAQRWCPDSGKQLRMEITAFGSRQGWLVSMPV